MENISGLQLIILSIGTIYTAFWVVLFFLYKKEAKLFDNLSEKDYPLKEIYFVGYGFLKMLRYSYQSKSDLDLKKKLSILYEKKYAEYYLRVIQAQRITMASVMIELAFLFYAFTIEPAMLLVCFVMAFVVYYYYGNVITERMNKRTEEMMTDFSEVVSQLALLINAGMVLREAWETVANSGNRLIYKEMRLAVERIENGDSEIVSYTEFGNRCMNTDIKKFTSTITQGISKGNRELGKMLQEQSSEIWKIKKQSVEEIAGKASTKLLLPMCIMFIGIIVLVIVPVFANMGAM